MLEQFFNSSTIVHVELVPVEVIVNKHCYMEILCCLQHSIHCKSPKLWHRKNWLLLHYNETAYPSVPVKEESILPYPPHSTDLASCDLFFFPHLKEKPCGRRFQSQEKPYRTSPQIPFSSVSSSYTKIGRLT
jgi:hypothetical protein